MRSVAVAGWDYNGIRGPESELLPDLIGAGLGTVEEEGAPDMAGVKVFLCGLLNRARGVFARAGNLVKGCPVALNLREFGR